ncbi:DUF167 family protein [Aestuariibacter halophilus]|uniref:UPF0235 protein LJ739_15000 n=1 Tax=Fluctibacter halophilus TaxID=226011 RepID=A0ABS8GCN8_9ALTE|nr:DUF167 family protein [Aestuariibacter halophilus]MCC2617559.1 DUF167 family protein [Aestuariibacter halophilus]
MTDSAVQHRGDDLLLRCYVQPKASRDAWVGLHGNELKVAITAPPVDGKANQHLCKFIAKQFGVSKSAVSVVKGHTSRHKTLSVTGISRLPDPLSKILSSG